MRKNAIANRERILDAAELVFAEEGSKGSTEEIARRADVGVATVFRHFPTKAALAEAALARHFDVLNERAARMAEQADPGPAFRDLVRILIELGSTKLTLAAQLRDGAFPPKIELASASLRDCVNRLLVRAQENGEVRDSANIDEIYLLIRGLAQATSTQATTPEILARAIDVVLDGLAPGARVQA